jgi:hypothetical protein
MGPSIAILHLSNPEGIERYGRMIRLLASPLPPLPSVSWTGDTQELRKKERQFCSREGGGGAWSRIIRPQESHINHSILSVSTQQKDKDDTAAKLPGEGFHARHARYV